MDHKTQDTLSVGSIAAVRSGIAGGPGGATIGGAIGVYLGSQEQKHHETLRDTHSHLHEATERAATIYVDHIQPNGAKPGGTKGVITAVSGAPDIICIAHRYSNLIVEVETVEAIQNNPNHVIEQLNEFHTQGFKRVLVVPNSEVDELIEWCEIHELRGDINQEAILSTPNSVRSVL